MMSSPGKSLVNIFKSRKAGQVEISARVRGDRKKSDTILAGLIIRGYQFAGIVGKGYMYLYNYKIGLWPAGNPELGYLDVDGGATKTEILSYSVRKGPVVLGLVFRKRKTNEEFFDLVNDPDCLNNLADDERLTAVKARMRARLEETLTVQKDPRHLGNETCSTIMDTRVT